MNHSVVSAKLTSLRPSVESFSFYLTDTFCRTHRTVPRTKIEGSCRIRGTLGFLVAFEDTRFDGVLGETLRFLTYVSPKVIVRLGNVVCWVVRCRTLAENKGRLWIR